MNPLSTLKNAGLGLGLSACFLLGACTEEKPIPAVDNTAFALDLQIPASLSGNVTPSQKSPRAVATDQPCAFNASSTAGDNPFLNGYTMTKFLVGVMSAWTCIADTVIEIAAVLPHDGAIHAGDNDFASDNYHPEDPTHYSVTDDSATQITVRTYYGYGRNTPPTGATQPDFFVSWNTREDGTITGRLIIETGRIQKDKPEDPDRMRMDFTVTDQQKTADMYLQFDNNPWADGFRIQLVKDLTASPLAQVFTVRGMMNMNRQFLENVTSGELPDLRMFTVSDKLGEGAARASFSNVVLPIIFNENNNFGEYTYVSDDRYFFQDDGDSDYVRKEIASAIYNGLRNTPSTGGTWPDDPSIDLIRQIAELPADYFEAPEVTDKCTNPNDSCVDFLNALFQKGIIIPDPNAGTDPQDWRSTALAQPSYLDSVYPAGLASWEGVFEPTFTP